IKNAKRLLKPIGKFYMVHRAHRLQEIVATLSKYNFNIEKIQFAHHKKGEKANLVLIKANKGIKKILEIQEPKYISEV
nr:16S rRNA methyltransferase [Fusobacteriaceae bacterium]